MFMKRYSGLYEFFAKLDFSNRLECKVVKLLIATVQLVLFPLECIHTGLVLTSLCRKEIALLLAAGMPGLTSPGVWQG